MTLENIAEKIKSKLSLTAPLGAKYKIDMGDDGIILVDCTGDTPAISYEDAEADTTLSCTKAFFESLLEGNEDPALAFMMGKIKVTGSMGHAMKLNALLED